MGSKISAESSRIAPPPSPVLQLFLASVLVRIAAVRSCCGCRTLFYSQERCLLIAIRHASFKDLCHRPTLLPGVLKGTAVVSADVPDLYAPLVLLRPWATEMTIKTPIMSPHHRWLLRLLTNPRLPCSSLLL